MGKSKLEIAQEERVSTQNGVDKAAEKLREKPNDDKLKKAFDDARIAAVAANTEAHTLEQEKKKADNAAALSNPPAKAKPLPFVKKDKSREEELNEFMEDKKTRAERQFDNQTNPNLWNIAPKKAPKTLTDAVYAEKRKQSNEDMDEFRENLEQQAGFNFKEQEHPNRFGIAPKKAPKRD